MLRFVVFRILATLPILLVLSMVTFAIIQAPPGDYADYIATMLVNRSGASLEMAQAQAELYRQAHGLNDPLPIQYLNWLWGIVTRFDFGHSLYYNKPVGNVVAERLPPTIMLALTCHLLASVLGIGLDTLEVTVVSVSDVRVLLGIADVVPAGPLTGRVAINE